MEKEKADFYRYLFQIYSEPADGNVIVKKGSSVSIKCGASGNPKPQVTWSKLNEVEVMGSGEVMELSQVRQLRGVRSRG